VERGQVLTRAPRRSAPPPPPPPSLNSAAVRLKFPLQGQPENEYDYAVHSWDPVYAPTTEMGDAQIVCNEGVYEVPFSRRIVYNTGT